MPLLHQPQALSAGTPKAQAITGLIAAMMKSQKPTASTTRLSEELRLIPTTQTRDKQTKNAVALARIKLCAVGDRGCGNRELLRSFMGADYAGRNPGK